MKTQYAIRRIHQATVIDCAKWLADRQNSKNTAQYRIIQQRHDQALKMLREFDAKYAATVGLLP